MATRRYPRRLVLRWTLGVVEDSALGSYRHHSPLWQAAIISLFTPRGPSTICGFVVSVVIDPFKRVILRWPSPHICEKVFTPHPSIAHLNPSLSVVFMAVVLRLLAAVFKPPPCRMLRRISHAMLTF